MSYNNYLDAEAAYSAVCDFDQPTCVIVKVCATSLFPVTRWNHITGQPLFMDAQGVQVSDPSAQRRSATTAQLPLSAARADGLHSRAVGKGWV
jgi:hypothetical protein